VAAFAYKARFHRQQPLPPTTLSMAPRVRLCDVSLMVLQATVLWPLSYLFRTCHTTLPPGYRHLQPLPSAERSTGCGCESCLSESDEALVGAVATTCSYHLLDYCRACGLFGSAMV
jgi:hypothetical protein